jgi:type II secretory pathway predicted ATPase ExeA
VSATELSRLKRQQIVDALRRGTVPRRGLEQFAVGMDRFEKAVDKELISVEAGQGVFKAIRGDYGTGKTFFSRWLEHRALQRGFATSLVQISETDTPLYRMETVYRRALENLQTKEWEQGAFRSLIERWFYALEEEVLGAGTIVETETEALGKAVAEVLEKRLASVSAIQPQFAAALRACHGARLAGDNATAEGLVGWLMAQPNVGPDIKRRAGLKGEVDGLGAAGFFRGLLELLRQTGRKGLLLVLDECETIQRVRGDLREKSLNALRQLVDDLDGGRYPGLYVMITGTPAFFEGPQGVKRLPPLEQRLHVDFSGNPKFDSAQAPQLRLLPFDLGRLVQVGRKVRDIYPGEHATRIAERVDDDVIGLLARGVIGKLGRKIGAAPRLFLRKLVGELLDKVDEHEDYVPKRDFELVVTAAEMTAEEREAAGIERSVDDIALDLGAARGPAGDGP